MMTSMIDTRTLHYTSGFAFVRGLQNMHKQGLKPQEMLFLALDRQGDVKLEITADPDEVDHLRVGHKLSLSPPYEGTFYIDSVHAVEGNVVLINGDRRLGRFASLVDVAVWISWFVRRAGNRSVFFGCTSHQPGSWWVKGNLVTPLHNSGFVDIVMSKGVGLLARRSMDHQLYFLPHEAAIRGDLDQWIPIYASPLGNLLMLERRLTSSRLVLSCQRGLVEVQLTDPPGVVEETNRMDTGGDLAVVGRIKDGAFSVTSGSPMEWGYDNLKPAKLVGSRGCSFRQLRKLLSQLDTDDW